MWPKYFTALLFSHPVKYFGTPFKTENRPTSSSLSSRISLILDFPLIPQYSPLLFPFTSPKRRNLSFKQTCFMQQRQVASRIAPFIGRMVGTNPRHAGFVKSLRWWGFHTFNLPKFCNSAWFFVILSDFFPIALIFPRINARSVNDYSSLNSLRNQILSDFICPLRMFCHLFCWFPLLSGSWLNSPSSNDSLSSLLVTSQGFISNYSSRLQMTACTLTPVLIL